MVQLMKSIFLSSNFHIFLLIVEFIFMLYIAFWYGWIHLKKERNMHFSKVPILLLSIWGLMAWSMEADGTPFWQWFIPVIFMLTMSLWLNGPNSIYDKKLNYAIWGLLILSTMILFHYFMITLTPRYSGCLLNEKLAKKLELTYHHSILLILREHQDDQTIYKEGYIEDIPTHEIQKKYAPLLFKSMSYKLNPEWHTFLTNVYRCDYYNKGIWYPGGKIFDALPNIKLVSRDSEEKSLVKKIPTSVRDVREHQLPVDDKD
jgi:hypothetical protein